MSKMNDTIIKNRFLIDDEEESESNTANHLTQSGSGIVNTRISDRENEVRRIV